MASSRGFTLVELLVVISIIGVLSSVVLASLTTARNKAKFSKAFSTMQDINNTAFNCLTNGTGPTNVTAPATGPTGGVSICANEPAVLPNLTSIGFSYCGNPTCGGWQGDGVSWYAISIYLDSSGGSKNIICGMNYDVSSWYGGSPNADFRNKTGCVKTGF